MRATLSEFRHRWWVIFSIFTVAFLAYFIDPKNAGGSLAEVLASWLGAKPTANFYRLVFAFGTLLVFLAACVRTWGTSYLNAEVMRDSRVHTERLLADGPYRFVRNPLYLGNILLAAGIGLMASRIGFFVLTLGMTVFVTRLILREEAELLRDQGEPYRRYCDAVPRLVPSIAPRVPSAGNTPDWGQGYRAEMLYWLMTLWIAAITVTLNTKVSWGLFALALVASWVRKRPRTKQGAETT